LGMSHSVGGHSTDRFVATGSLRLLWVLRETDLHSVLTSAIC